MVSWWLINCQEVAEFTFVCLFVLFVLLAQGWLYRTCVNFLKCINSTLSLQILPFSFHSSNWKQLSSRFFSYYLWFNYLIKLIITITYSVLIIRKIIFCDYIFSFCCLRWKMSKPNFVERRTDGRTDRHTDTLAFYSRYVVLTFPSFRIAF